MTTSETIAALETVSIPAPIVRPVVYAVCALNAEISRLDAQVKAYGRFASLWFNKRALREQVSAALGKWGAPHSPENTGLACYRPFGEESPDVPLVLVAPLLEAGRDVVRELRWIEKQRTESPKVYGDFTVQMDAVEHFEAARGELYHYTGTRIMESLREREVCH